MYYNSNTPLHAHRKFWSLIFGEKKKKKENQELIQHILSQNIKFSIEKNVAQY